MDEKHVIRKRDSIKGDQSSFSVEINYRFRTNNIVTQMHFKIMNNAEKVPIEYDIE